MSDCATYECIDDYVPENSCQCNSECELYNDCCSGMFMQKIPNQITLF